MLSKSFKEYLAVKRFLLNVQIQLCGLLPNIYKYIFIILTPLLLEVLHRKASNIRFIEIVLEFNYSFIGLSMYKIRKMFSMYVF